MRYRNGTAAGFIAVVLSLTACEPTNTDADADARSTEAPTIGTSTSQPASPKTDTPKTDEPTGASTPAEKNGSEYGGYDTEGGVDTSDYNFVCSRLTAAEASNALGKQFTAIPESAEMPMPKGMAHCTYRVSDQVKFTVDYLGDAGWANHKRLADNNESGYRNQPDGSISIEGPLGSGYVMRDDNSMMLVVQEIGVSKLVGLDKFRMFAQTLPGQIN